LKILVTGGAGFIGTSVVRQLLGDGDDVVNLDKLTYAGSNPPLGALGEGGRYGHGRMLDELVIRPVLVLAGPGVPPGRHATRVRLIDVYPTLLELAAGIEAPCDGEDLARVWSGGEQRDRDVFVQGTYAGTDLRAAIVGDFKLVWDLRAGVESLYDLARDPREHRNLRDALPERAGALRAALGRRWDLSVNSVVLSRRVRRESCAAGDRSACD